MHLEAITDDCKYAGKRMALGEQFEVPDSDKEAARLLKGFGKAREVAQAVSSEPETSGDIDALRSRYRTMRAQEPDMRWGIGRLQRETAAAGYNRRDMRAED